MRPGSGTGAARGWYICHSARSLGGSKGWSTQTPGVPCGNGAAAAEAGDHVSRDICMRAARELVHSTVTGLRQAKLTDADCPAVGLLGGVMKSQLIHTAIVEEISVTMPGARIVELLGEGLDGAAALPTISPDSPLGQRIHVAQ